MTAASEPGELAARVGPVEQWLVVLDFDGTLSPIVDHPDAARPAPGAVAAVRALATRTAVAVVSGRPVTQLQERLGRLPVAWAGGHGAELVTPEGDRVTAVDPAAVRRTLDTVEHEVAEVVDTADGFVIERKDASLAVHHRRVPDGVAAATVPRVTAVLEAHRDDPPGFQLLAGKAVLELRPTGVDKGRAVAWLADREPDRAPLVVGDDVTDEDAFREALARGGTAVLVAHAARESAAPWRLTDPDAVVSLLELMAGTVPEG